MSQIPLGISVQAADAQPFLSTDADYDDDGFEEDEVSDEADEAIEVIIPHGLKEGALFIALVGDEEFEVTVPPGFKGGDTLALDVPETTHVAGRQEMQEHPHTHDGKARKKTPKRQVSFTEEEPSVIEFRPELGGLSLASPEKGSQSEQPEKDDSPQTEQVLDVVLPLDVSAGEILEVESETGETIQVVVPEDMEAGMTLTVKSPMSKSMQADFGEATISEHDEPQGDRQAQQVAQQASKESFAPEEPSDPPALLKVVIPEDVSAGDVLEVESPEGEKVEVVVSEDMEAGRTLTVESPKNSKRQMDFGEATISEHDEPQGDRQAQQVAQQTSKESFAPEEPSDPPALLKVVISEDVSAGDVLEVESPEGEKVEVVVSEDMEAGRTLTVESPKNSKRQMDFGEATISEHDEPQGDRRAQQVAQQTSKESFAPEEPSDPPALLKVVIPEDMSAGDVLEVESPEGEKVEVVVSEDMEAGRTLTVESPKSSKRQMDFGEATISEHDEPQGDRQAQQVAQQASKESFAPEEPSDPPALLKVVIPEDVSAGDVLEVESPEGEKVEVVVSEDMEAGRTLTVESPKNSKRQMDFGEATISEHDEPQGDRQAQQVAQQTSKESFAPEEPSDPPALLKVVIPEDVSAGDVLEVESPEGEKVEVVVSEDMEAGRTLTVESPKNSKRQTDIGEVASGHQAKQSGLPLLVVVIPEGASSGDVLHVESDGETVEVTVPRGMEAGMTLTMAEVDSRWEQVTVDQLRKLQSDTTSTMLSDVEMDAILQPLQGDTDGISASRSESHRDRESHGPWRTLTQLGGGEVMKLRRWPESQSDGSEDVLSGKARYSFEFEPFRCSKFGCQ